ncbi:MAG TPA: ABC transporter substrate-binding protein, partial [Dehalococcoidia bacterium]|nr:ABC transporter substrate-binding protein [Dehalococcoidia bacterium]
MRRKIAPLRWFILIALLGTLLGLAACGDDEESGATATPGGGSPTGQFAGTIKIGSIVDKSGVAGGSPIALSYEPGMQAAIKKINDAGGVKVQGQSYRLELISRDARSDPVAGVALAQEMLQQKVIAVNPSTFIWFDQAYQQLKDSVITFMNLPQGLNLLQFEGASKHPLLFSSIELAVPIIVGWHAQIKGLFPNVQRIGYLAQDDPLARGVEVGLQATAQQLGMQFVGAQYGPVGTSDWSTQITNLRAQRPDLVYVLAGPNTAQAAKQAIEQNLAPYLELPGARPEDVKLLGDLKDKTIISLDWRQPFYRNATPPDFKAAVDSLGTLQGQNLQYGFAISYHDFVYLLKQAIE